MAKFDIESLMDGLQTFLAANLNAQISALNTEKGDGIVLKPVNSAAYHLQYPQDRTELFDPFIVLDESDEPSIQGRGALLATVHHVGITFVLVDNGQDVKIVRRLYRYRRALLDLILANWSTMVGSHKFEVQAWSPSPPFNMGEDLTARVVGVTLSVAIAD